LLGYAKVYFHIPYRQKEGIAQGHAKGKVPAIPDYTTINRLNNKIKDGDDKDKDSIDDNFVIAIDSTGIKVTNRGQWMREKWNVKNKRYLKIHVCGSRCKKSKKILSMKVTDLRIHNSKALPSELVETIIESDGKLTIGKIFANSASIITMTFLDVWKTMEFCHVLK